MYDTKDLILDRLRLVAPAVDEAMAAAILQAETRAKGFDHHRFPHTRPLSIRQDVRLALEADVLLGGWRVAGDPRKMGQLILVDGTSGMELRFLKAPYTQPDRIPHAGRNSTRRSVWAQQPIPELRHVGGHAQTQGLRGVKFLLIWAYLDADVRTNGYDLRVVHTLEAGKFGASTLCDVDLAIPRGGILREGDLRFAGLDDEEDLFSFGLEAEEGADSL